MHICRDDAQQTDDIRQTSRPSLNGDEASGQVSTGDMASVTVSVSPRARCTIGVYYSTPASRAAGLGAKTGT